MRTYGRGIWLIAASIALAVLTVWVQTRTPPNVLAGALLQSAVLVFGIYGSWVLGQVSASLSAQEMIKPHAASAFRRMLNIYQGLGRLKTAISEQGSRLEDLRGADEANVIGYENARWALTVIDVMVTEQIQTGEDALNDWRDLAPDEVARIEKQARDSANARRESGKDV